jgi:hypothetical protein
MPAGPMPPISVRALLPYWHGPLGQLFTPRLLTSLDITEGCGMQRAAENDCFNGFDPAATGN